VSGYNDFQYANPEKNKKLTGRTAVGDNSKFCITSVPRVQAFFPRQLEVSFEYVTIRSVDTQPIDYAF